MATNISNKYLLSWLKFDRTPTEDAKNNNWIAYGNPTIGPANAINGNALQLDGQSYLKLSDVELGGQDFYIDGWVYVDPASPNYARLISIVDPSTGIHMLTVRKSPTDSTKLDFWANSYSNLSKNNGYTYTSNTDCIGVKVHFKLIYRYNNHIIDLCINDKIVANWSSTYVPEYLRRKVEIYVGANFNGSQGLIGSIDELRIWDGTWFSYNYGNVPTAENYSNIIMYYGLQRNIINPPLTFRYENPGTANLLTVAGTTVTGLDETQSRTGTAFYQTQRVKCFDIPATEEIWIKFDVYTTLSQRWRAYNGGSNGFSGFTSQTTGGASLFSNETNVKQFSSSTIKNNQRQVVLLHMISDSSNGIIEVWLDGEKLYTYTGNVNKGEDFADIYLQSEGSGTFFSNVIISNDQIGIDEDVAELSGVKVNMLIDVQRNVSNVVTVNHDTERDVINAETLELPVVRNLEKEIDFSVDLMRVAEKAVTIDVDLLREVEQPNLETVDLDVDIQRQVKKSVVAKFDTTRKLNKSTELLNDTIREITKGHSNIFDLLRDVTVPAQFALDIGRNVTNEVEVNVDIERDIDFVWRYENYGTADLLKISGTTVTGLDFSKSKTGSAFWQSQRVAAFPIPATKELWVKFDLYYGNAQWRAYDRLNGNDTGVGVYQTSQGLIAYINGPTSYLLKPQNPFTTSKLYTVLLHMVSDAENGLLEVWIDGEKYYSEDFASEGLIYKGNVENGADFENFYLQTPNANNLFSNVIISNAKIGLGENVVGYGLTTTLDFDVTREIDRSIAVDVDIVREVETPGLIPVESDFDLIRNVIRVYRYENYGTADLFPDNPDYPTFKETFQVTREQSKYYSGCYCNHYFGIRYDDTNYTEQTNEQWIKFDVYTVLDNSTTTRWNLEARSYGRTGLTAQKNGDVDLWVKNTRVGIFENIIKFNQLQTFIFHLNASANGIAEFWVDGEKIGSFEGDAEYPGFNNILWELRGDEGGFFSNIIVSNVEISFNENAKMPLNVDFDLVRSVSDSSVSDFELTLDFDLVREVKKIWRYQNVGTADLVGTTVTGLEKSKAKYGTALVNTQKVKTFDIPSTKEIWIRFDVFSASEADRDTLYDQGKYYDIAFGCQNIFFGENNVISGVSISSTIEQGYYEVYLQAGNNSKTDRYPLNSYEDRVVGVFTSWLLHMVSDSENGLIELQVNGVDGDQFWNSGHGLKVFSYSGNVNNGNDFDNIALSSSYGENLFSNIIISNDVVEIDQSYKIPVEVSLDLERYLTYMYFGDTWRYENYGTANLLSVAGTTVELEQSESKYYSGFYQTQRVKCFDIPATKGIWIKFDLYFYTRYQTLFVGSLDNEKTNQVRLNCCGTSNDYHRIIFALSNSVANNQANQLYSGTLYRILLHMVSDDTNGKIELFVSDGYNLSYTGNVNNGNNFENVYIQASNYNNISTYPWVSNVIISNAEISLDENCKVPIVDLYDLQRRVIATFTYEEYYDLFRNVVLSQFLNVDTKRELIRSADINADFLRNVTRSIEFDCDMTRINPFTVNISPIEHAGDDPWPGQDTTGIQSIEIRLGEQQLTDEVTCVSYIDFAPLDYVSGKYLDYEYSIRAEKIVKQGAMTTCQFCADIDEILYSQIEYKIPDSEQWHRTDTQTPQLNVEEDLPMAPASSHVNTIAAILGKQPQFQCTDFISTVDIEAGGVTYNDLIRDIFGWTARIPTIMVNCYLRAENLYVIQRGHEANVIDLTNTNHSKPVFTREVIRTTWGSSPTSKTETREHKAIRWRSVGNSQVDELPKQSGTHSQQSSGGSSSGSSGNQEQSTEEHHNGVTKRTTYEYYPDGLLKSTTVYEDFTNDNSSYTYTTYEYITLRSGRKFLSVETTKIYEKGEEIDSRTIEHEPLDQGQEHVVAHSDVGEYLGGVVGQTKGDDRITPYLQKQLTDENEESRKTAEGTPYTWQEQRTLNGICLFDTSFPVHGDDMLIVITDCIKWLNRKTQETVTMEVRNYNHLIDFNDRIVFEGNEYYLQSNTAIKTTRIKNKQTISIVRWY